MFGQTYKKASVQNDNDDGASKDELVQLTRATFPELEPTSPIGIQAWDKDFEGFADIEDGEMLKGPVKVRVVQSKMFPVQFSGDAVEVAGGIASLLDESSAESVSMDTSSDVSSDAESSIRSSANTLPVEEVTPPRKVASMIAFVMPKQPPNLESKLRNGADLTEGERSIFLQNVYDAVISHTGKYHPTKTMYDYILREMFRRYPKLALPQPNIPCGDMKKFWKDRLLYKFRNNRRRCDKDIPEVKLKQLKKRRTEKSVTATKTDDANAPQWGMPCYLPGRPLSEDDETVNKHISFLQQEKRKRQPDYNMVRIAMQQTLADRREWLVNSIPRPRITEIKDRYPWLFCEVQMSEEMMRLQDTDQPLVSTLEKGLHKYGQSLILKAKARKSPDVSFMKCASTIAAHRGEEERQRATCEAAFLAIPGLLQEKLSDIFVSPGSDEVKSAVHLALPDEAAEISSASSYKLVADGVAIATSEQLLPAVALWLSGFYILNLAYPKCIARTLCFIQKVVLDIQDDLQPLKAVITLTNKLNIENNYLTLSKK